MPLVEVWLTSRGLPRRAFTERSGDIEIAFVQARQRGPHYLRWRKEINLKVFSNYSASLFIVALSLSSGSADSLENG